jgi:hypothetical protein
MRSIVAYLKEVLSYFSTTTTEGYSGGSKTCSNATFDALKAIA